MPKVKTIIVCNSGVSTANLVASMLSKVLSIEIVSISSSKTFLDNLKEYNPDLIITTLDLEDHGIPLVKISALVKSEELKKVEEIINSIYRNTYGMSDPTVRLNNSLIKNSPEKLFSNSFFKLLSPDRVEIYEETANWQSAIKLAGSLLVKSGIVSELYVNKMIEIVSELGPYIIMAPNVAVAHARPVDGYLKNGVSLIILKKPVRFDEDKNDIYIIMALSLSNNQDKNQDIIKSMHAFISNETLRKKLMASSNKEWVYSQIKLFFDS